MGLFMVAANVITCWTYSKLWRSVSKCLLAITWKVTFWCVYHTL